MGFLKADGSSDRVCSIQKCRLLTGAGKQASSQPRSKQVVVQTLRNVAWTAQDDLENRILISVCLPVLSLANI